MSTDSLATNIVDFPAHKVKGFERPKLIEESNPVTDETILDCLYRGEEGSAELLAHLYHDKLVFDSFKPGWYSWAKDRWQEEKRVRQLVMNEVADTYINLAGRLRTPSASKDSLDNATALCKKAASLRNLRLADHVVTIAQDFLGMSEQWDANPLLLGVENGVIDLETGELREYQPSDYIRTTAPVEWTGLDAPAPLWDIFLKGIFADYADLEGIMEFLQRLFGYGITGKTKQYVPIFYGPKGRNGKGVLLSTIGAVLGDKMASPVHSDVMIDAGRRRSPGAHQSHIVQLNGKRLAWIIETEQGGRIDTAQLKLLSGEDDISTRESHGKQFNFTPRFMLMLVTNRWPRLPHDDLAAWERILPIVLNQRFVESPTGPNEHEYDPNLKDWLRAELSGVLAWLVRGCINYQENGICIPDCVKQAKDEFRLNADPLVLFIDDCLRFGESRKIRADRLYEEYRKWANSTGFKPVLGQTAFGLQITSRLEELGCAKKRGSGGMEYRGVSL